MNHSMRTWLYKFVCWAGSNSMTQSVFQNFTFLVFSFFLSPYVSNLVGRFIKLLCTSCLNVLSFFLRSLSDFSTLKSNVKILTTELRGRAPTSGVWGSEHPNPQKYNSTSALFYNKNKCEVAFGHILIFECPRHLLSTYFIDLDSAFKLNYLNIVIRCMDIWNILWKRRSTLIPWRCNEEICLVLKLYISWGLGASSIKEK